jgi:hypothetical protein
MLFTKRCALQQTHGMDNHGDPCLRQALKPQNKSCFASLPDRIPNHNHPIPVLRQRTADDVSCGISCIFQLRTG